MTTIEIAYIVNAIAQLLAAIAQLFLAIRQRRCGVTEDAIEICQREIGAFAGLVIKLLRSIASHSPAAEA